MNTSFLRHEGRFPSIPFEYQPDAGIKKDPYRGGYLGHIQTEEGIWGKRASGKDTLKKLQRGYYSKYPLITSCF